MSDYFDCDVRYVGAIFGEEGRRAQAIGAMIWWGKQVGSIGEKLNRLESVQRRGASLWWAQQEGVADQKLQELIKVRALERVKANKARELKRAKVELERYFGLLGVIKQGWSKDEELQEARDLADVVTKGRGSTPQVMFIYKSLADAIAKGRAVQYRKNQILSEIFESDLQVPEGQTLHVRQLETALAAHVGRVGI